MCPAPPVGNGDGYLCENHPVVHVLVGHIVIEVPGAHGHGRQPFAAFHALAVFLRLDVLFREQVFRAAVERLVHRYVIGCRGLRFAEV